MQKGNPWQAKEAAEWVKRMPTRDVDIEFFSKLHKEYDFDSFIEYGCGTGRLTRFFRPEKYLGYDFNPECLKVFPKQYESRICDLNDPLPYYEVVFTNDVLLHVNDQDLPLIAEHMTSGEAQFIIIREIMDPKYRIPHRAFSPTWSREFKDYVEVFEQLDYALAMIGLQSFDYHGKPTDITAIYLERK